jgi:hypothetical protein
VYRENPNVYKGKTQLFSAVLFGNFNTRENASVLCFRDITDLVFRAEAFEQAIPKDGPVPTYEYRYVYFETVHIQVTRTKTANLPDENVYTENHISNS